MALFPYAVLHYYNYGSMIPGSRLEILGDGSQLKNVLVVGARVVSDWFYGIPKYSFFNPSNALLAAFPIGLFIFFIRDKIDLFGNETSNALMFASILTLPVCMVTGRYHPGLWTFVGIIFVIALANIIVDTLNKFSLTDAKRTYCLTTFILLLLFFNLESQPFQRMSHSYKDVNESSIVAFNLINSGIKKLTVVRLPGAEELPHMIAFWIGNQIYHKHPGLVYFKEANILRMSNMFIEVYKNADNKNFPFFEGFLNKRKNDSFILFKNRNSFFTFDGGKSHSALFRAASLPNSPSDFYDIYLPRLVNNVSAKKKLTIELELDRAVSNSDKLIYGGTSVLEFNVDGNKIIFVTDDQRSPNRISMISDSTKKSIPLKTIEIFSPINMLETAKIKAAGEVSFPSVSTSLTPCNFELKSPFVDVYISMGPMSNLSLDTLYPISVIWPSFVVKYWSFDTHRDTRMFRSNLQFNGDTEVPIECI